MVQMTIIQHQLKSSDGLAPSRQSITGVNDDPFGWYMYASFGLNFLNFVKQIDN